MNPPGGPPLRWFTHMPEHDAGLRPTLAAAAAKAQTGRALAPTRRPTPSPDHDMMNHSTAPSTATGLRHSLGDAADRADRRLVEAAQEADRAHRQIERALQRGDGAQALRERRWQGRIDPLVDRLSTSARQLARQSMDMASHAGSRAQESLHHYADATSGYISRQPMRSVLIAAAVGAAVAALLASSRRRY